MRLHVLTEDGIDAALVAGTGFLKNFSTSESKRSVICSLFSADINAPGRVHFTPVDFAWEYRCSRFSNPTWPQGQPKALALPRGQFGGTLDIQFKLDGIAPAHICLHFWLKSCE